MAHVDDLLCDILAIRRQHLLGRDAALQKSRSLSGTPDESDPVGHAVLLPALAQPVPAVGNAPPLHTKAGVEA